VKLFNDTAAPGAPHAPRRRSFRIRAAGVVGIGALVASGLVALALPNSAQAASQAYTWKNVNIAGGGFVPGIVFSPVQKDLIYARTDIGGAYRWEQSTSTWTPLLDWADAAHFGYNGVAAIAPDPVDANKVYAAVGMYTNSWDPNPGAILRSSDKGATWAITELPFKLGGNMPGRGIGERLAIDPNNNKVLYLGAPSGNGLWRSTDSGVTWAKVTAFPNVGNYVQDPTYEYTADNLGVTWVSFDKSTAASGSTTQGIYVGVADKDNPVYRSLDGGVTWSAVPGTPTGYLAHKGVVDPVNHLLYIATSDTAGPYDGAKGDVAKFDIAAGTWTTISPIPSTSADDYFGYSALTIDRQNPSTIMVTTQISWWPDIIVFRSTDSGATWTRIWDFSSYPSRTDRYTQDITSVPWLSLGANPAPPETAPKLGWMVESMEIDPFNSDRMMYGTGATLYGTTNLTAWDAGGQITIKPMVAGLEETAANDLISPPTGAPLISALGDIGGFRHADVTKVPTVMFQQPYFTTTTSLDYAELNPGVIVRAGSFTDTDRPNDSHAAFSTDGGANWFQGTEPSGVNSGGTIAASADGSNFVWAPGDAGIQVVHSTGFGNTWTASTGIPANAVIESDRVNPTKFYGLAAGTFYVSTDSGATFTAAATGLTGTHFKAVAGHEGDIWLNGSAGLFHSTDSGATFTQVAGVDSGLSVGFGAPAPGQTYPAIFIIGTVGGVNGAHRSDDGGATWVRINDDQHQYGNWGEAITGDPRIYGRVYVGTNGRGVLYADIAG
jgi:xyloglucan-specific exo-beta-1,4-glucanase